MKIVQQDGSLTAFIQGEIDHHSAKNIRGQLDENLERLRPEQLFLDFSGVSFMDSSGIGLVMGRYKLAQQVGCRLKVVGMSPYIERLMKLSGLGILGVL